MKTVKLGCRAIRTYTSLGVFMFALLLPTESQAQAVTMEFTGIQATGHGYLELIDGKLKFVKKPGPLTVWTLEFGKDGVSIALSGREGAILGINPEKKELALFEKPGPTTAWRLKSAQAGGIRPPRRFEALLFMKIDGEELRLSSDEKGMPVLGGKAAIMNFQREGP